MITQNAKDTAVAIVAALNDRIKEYGSAAALWDAMFWTKFEDPDSKWKLAHWAKEVDVNGYKWNLIDIKFHSTFHTKNELSRYFILKFMGCDIAIGLTGELHDGIVYWDNKFSYGSIKYQPYYSKGL